MQEDDVDIQVGDRGMTLDEIRTRYLTVPRGPSVIVVGPDRVGKTTVVNHISRILGIPKFKCPAEKKIFKEGGRHSLAFDYTLTHFLSQTGMRFISDRGYPCEWVYSRVFGRETDRELLGLIDTAHCNLGTKILLLYSSETPEEEDDLVPKAMYSDVLREYGKFAQLSYCDIVRCDTADMLRAYKSGRDISESAARDCINRMGI